MAKTGEPTNCTIGEGSVFSGKFYVNGSILIEGKFQGDIRTEDQLIVGPTGKVRTDIVAKSVTIAGTLIGNIVASEEVNLVETGRVLGDICTPKLNVEPGVVTKGKVTITSGSDAADVQKTVEAAFGEEAEQIFAEIQKDRKKTKEQKEERRPQNKAAEPAYDTA